MLKSPNSKAIILKHLFDMLQKSSAFWSYKDVDLGALSDELLIEKVLYHLDLEDINLIFCIFPKKQIKSVWRGKLCPLEPFFHSLNWLYAFLYFDIKNPSRYIQVAAKHYQNQSQRLL